MKNGLITLITEEMQTLNWLGCSLLARFTKIETLEGVQFCAVYEETTTLMNSWWEYKQILSLLTAIWQ